jgi:CRISPR-associated protein Csc1
MQIYRGILELMDYVFFATVERGKVYETGTFIHNYALTYAFGLVKVPYAHLIQEPHYEGDLAPLNEIGIYLTPATPLQVAHRLVQWNTIQETYGLGKKLPSIGYPDWGFARMLRPGSLFEFYILIENPDAILDVPAFCDGIAGRIARIRLGKFPGKARVRFQRAKRVIEKTGSFTTKTLLNWRDLPQDPKVFDILAISLPTRLIYNARFEKGTYYQVKFADEDKEISLPSEMRFLARPMRR